MGFVKKMDAVRNIWFINQGEHFCNPPKQNGSNSRTPSMGCGWRYQVAVNAVPYNAAANACDDWKSSLHLFTEVQRNRLSTSITYGTLVKKDGQDDRTTQT